MPSLACPFCAADPGRIPQRRYLCAACGNRVAVRTIAGGRLPYLLPEEAAIAYDVWRRAVPEGRGSPLHDLARTLVYAPDPDTAAIEWAQRHNLWDHLVAVLRDRGEDTRGARRAANAQRLDALAERHADDPDAGVILLQSGAWCDPVEAATGWLPFAAASQIEVPAEGCHRDRCRCRWVVARRSEVEVWGWGFP